MKAIEVEMKIMRLKMLSGTELEFKCAPQPRCKCEPADSDGSKANSAAGESADRKVAR